MSIPLAVIVDGWVQPAQDPGGFSAQAAAQVVVQITAFTGEFIMTVQQAREVAEKLAALGSIDFIITYEFGE